MVRFIRNWLSARAQRRAEAEQALVVDAFRRRRDEAYVAAHADRVIALAQFREALERGDTRRMGAAEPAAVLATCGELSVLTGHPAPQSWRGRAVSQPLARAQALTRAQRAPIGSGS